MPASRIIPAAQSSLPLPPLHVYYLADFWDSSGGLDLTGNAGPYHRWLGDKHDHAEQPRFVLDIPSDIPCFAEGCALLKNCRDGFQPPQKHYFNEREEARKEYLEWERRFPVEILWRLHNPLSLIAQKVLLYSNVCFKNSDCKNFVTNKLLDMDHEEKARLSLALKERYLKLFAFWSLLNRAAYRIRSSKGELLLIVCPWKVFDR